MELNENYEQQLEMELSKLELGDNLLQKQNDFLDGANPFDDDNKSSSSGTSAEELPPIDFDNLPLHACSYCGIHDPDQVVKCVSKNCNKWFCNGRGKVKMASHIIYHFVKTKHKELILHPQSSSGETALECYVCGSKNTFLLGFVPIQTSQELESQAIIICRFPCLNTKQFNEFAWSITDFTSLIEEKSVVNWLVKPPSLNEQRRARQISTEQINILEELWKNQPNATFKDIEKNQQKEQLQPLLLRYIDGEQYINIFLPLIKAEEEYDKKVREGQTQSNITVRWETSLSKKILAYFVIGSKEDFECNLLPGNELRLILKSQQYSSKGTVVRITEEEEICLEMYGHENHPTNINQGYSVEFVWKSTAFERMKAGLTRFWKDEKRHQVNPPQIDYQYPQSYNAPNLPQLNEFQIEAVKKALKSPLTLIQGPPGTGKTVTSASIIYHLCKQIQKKYGSGQILVCAPSNIVVDQLADKIQATGLKVVRLCSKSREAVSSNIEYLTLHNQVRSLDIPKYNTLMKLFELKEDQGELDPKDEKQFRKLRDNAEMEILSSADVVITTCVASADPRLRSFTFQQVLIDEATQAIEPECLLPLLKGCKQAILVGDHRQLQPVVINRETSKAGLSKSLFERLAQMGIRPFRLQIQYRMHPDLSVFSSNTFYEGTLQNGVSNSDRQIVNDFPWPNKNKPLFFYNLYGVEEMSASGTSYLNRTEAVQVEKIINRFIKSGVKPQQIGIITPYKGQRSYIMNYLIKSGQLDPNAYKQIEVASVDGFQGREKDFIIVSCVRSNEGLGIGFLTDPRRLNVTLTRARYGLIICGNAKVLSRDNLWNNLLNFCKQNEILVEGTLDNLKQTSLKFRPAQKYIPDRRKNYTSQEDAQSSYSYATSSVITEYQQNTSSYYQNQHNFDTMSLSSLCLSNGYRDSAFGFNIIPDSQPFQKIQKVAEGSAFNKLFSSIQQQPINQSQLKIEKDKNEQIKQDNQQQQIEDDQNQINQIDFDIGSFINKTSSDFELEESNNNDFEFNDEDLDELQQILPKQDEYDND